MVKPSGVSPVTLADKIRSVVKSLHDLEQRLGLRFTKNEVLAIFRGDHRDYRLRFSHDDAVVEAVADFSALAAEMNALLPIEPGEPCPQWTPLFPTLMLLNRCNNRSRITGADTSQAHNAIALADPFNPISFDCRKV